jgi:hypothetical protein
VKKLLNGALALKSNDLILLGQKKTSVCAEDLIIQRVARNMETTKTKGREER